MGCLGGPQWNVKPIYTMVLLACLEQNLPSGYCQVSSRSTAIVFDDVQSSLGGFPKNHFICNEGLRRTRTHLAVSTRRVLFRTSEGTGCAYQIHISLWASMAARMMTSSHSTLTPIAITQASLTPTPLVATWHIPTNHKLPTSYAALLICTYLTYLPV